MDTRCSAFTLWKLRSVASRGHTRGICGDGKRMAAHRASSDASRPSQISAKQRDLLRDATLSGIKRILAAAAALHKSAAAAQEDKSDDLLVVAAGLYTYAFEEYGKLLLIDDMEERGGAVLIPRAMFHSHDQKFKRAEKGIPEEYRVLRKPLIDQTTFARLYDANSLGPTFPGRMLSFYADIDSKGNPTRPPTPDPELLEKAMRHLGLAVAKWEERNGDDISDLWAEPSLT